MNQRGAWNKQFAFSPYKLVSNPLAIPKTEQKLQGLPLPLPSIFSYHPLTKFSRPPLRYSHSLFKLRRESLQAKCERTTSHGAARPRYRFACIGGHPCDCQRRGSLHFLRLEGYLRYPFAVGCPSTSHPHQRRVPWPQHQLHHQQQCCHQHLQQSQRTLPSLMVSSNI